MKKGEKTGAAPVPGQDGHLRVVAHRVDGDRARESRVAALLVALDSSGDETAWRAFLDEWSPLLARVARNHARYDELANDCFLFLCERLVENRYRRLRQFDAARGVAFSAWLSVVANNLARDWWRQEYGRRRLPSAIRRLDDYERAVFRLRIERRLPLTACRELLRQQFPGQSARLPDALERIHQVLSSRQRWRWSFRGARADRARDAEPKANLQLVSTDASPLQALDDDARRGALEAALNTLDAEQRLLVRLRFQEQLSLAEVARAAGLTNLHMARRRLDAALAALRSALAESGIRGSGFEDR